MSSGEEVGLTIVGAGIGFAVGGPAGALYGAQIGMTVASSFFSDDIVSHSSGPRLNDLKIQVSHPGWNIPKGWGTVGHAGAVFWSGDINEVSTTTETEQGGKGGPTQVQSHTTHEYTASFAVLFHDGEISAVRRIWANDKLVYDAGSVDDYGVLSNDDLTDWMVLKSENLIDDDGVISIYLGTETQQPDPTIQSYEGVANTPAHRGKAYIVFTDFDLAEYGNSIPNITVEYINTSKPFDTPLQIVKTIPYEGYYSIADSAVINNSVVCVDDDLTSHLIIGDWDTSYTRSRIKYYKVFPNGEISYDRDFQLAAGAGEILVSNSEYPSAFFHNVTKSTLVLVQLPNPSGVLEAYSLNIGDISVTSGTLVQSIVQVGNVNRGTIVLWADPVNNGTLFRRYVYTFNPLSGRGLSYTDINVDGGDKACFSYSDQYLSVVYTDNRILRYDHYGDLIETWAFTPDYPLTAQHSGGYSHHLEDGRVYIANAGHLHLVNDGIYSYLGEIEATSVQGDPFYIKSRMMIRSRRHDSDIDFITLGDVKRTDESLSDIVSDLCLNSGLSVNDIDVTAISDIDVDGFIKSNMSPSTSNIKPLLAAFQFSAYDDDGKLIFVPRNGVVSATIDEGDLGSGIDDSTGDILKYARLDDLSLPKTLDVSYINYEKRYDQGSQSSKRSDAVTSTEKRESLQLPIVMTDTTARQIAEKTQQITWTARNNYTQIRLPLKYLTLVPTDVFETTVDGDKHRIRVTSLNIGQFIEINGINETATDYNSVIEADITNPSYESGTSRSGTQLYILDSPTLRDVEGYPLHYVAAHGTYGNWPGCSIHLKDVYGGYANVASLTEAITAGVTDDVLPDGAYSVIDYASSVTLRMRNGTLSSVTKATVLSNKAINAALIGVNGRWELIQFMTAVPNSDNTYTISGLIRGQNGSEWAMGLHEVNDLFVLLDETKMSSIIAGFRNVEVNYKAVTISRPFKTGSDYSFINTLESIKPMAPAGLKATRVAVTSYRLTWNRRARLMGEWNDYVDVPLTESNERYRIEHYINGVLFGTVFQFANSLNVSANPGDGFLVAQVSENYGDGHQSQVTLV